MGSPVDREEFEERDYVAFAARLEQSVAALRLVLERPGFGVGPPTIGAELEMALVDRAGQPLLANDAVVAALPQGAFTHELARFSFECNSTPVALAGAPLSTLGAELDAHLARARAAAAAIDGKIALIGILPTLRHEHLTADALTDAPRYRAMNAGLRRLRGEPFRLLIPGDDVLALTTHDVTFEGANTSFQLHLRIDPADFADTYNAAQLATAIALAAGGNAPLFLGYRLWQETRIALFTQAVDDRDRLAARVGGRPRVGFGDAWVSGPLELFEASVAHHAPVLPVLDDEDPLEVARAGAVPRLAELRLHHGTSWRWNRAIYDPADGGHLRIELRALPSGPTVADMLASAALLLGLTLALRRRARVLVGRLPFAEVAAGFYRAAQRGLDASLPWLDPRGEVVQVPARALIASTLPLARAALLDAGVDAAEVDRHLAIVQARAASGQTGARWQRARLAELEKGTARPAALAALVTEYVERSEGGAPVHTWPIAPGAIAA